MEIDLSACIRGDKIAWDTFVERFAPLLHAAVARTAAAYGERDEACVQDAVQEVFVRLIKDDFRLLRSYDASRSALSTWLTLVARSKAVDTFRKSRRDPVLTDHEVDNLPSPEQSYTAEVRIPPGLLSPRQQLVLHLMYDREQKVPDVARLLRVSPQTVRSAKHKALSRLREHFRIDN